MNTLKLIRIPLVLILLLGAAFFSTACKKNSMDDAADKVQDAANSSADAIKDATN